MHFGAVAKPPLHEPPLVCARMTRKLTNVTHGNQELNTTPGRAEGGGGKGRGRGGRGAEGRRREH